MVHPKYSPIVRILNKLTYLLRVGNWKASGPWRLTAWSGCLNWLKDKEVNIGGSYDLGVANVNAKFGKNTLRTAIAASGLVPGVAAAEYTYYSIGAKIPMGSGYIPVSYNNSKNNVDSKSANQFAVGYVYNLSKRTMAYTTYSKITNKNGATYGFNGGNGGFGSGLAPTGNGTGFDLGLRHAF
jgi:predicted porin